VETLLDAEHLTVSATCTSHLLSTCCQTNRNVSLTFQKFSGHYMS